MFGLLPRGTAYIVILALVVFAAANYVPIYFNAFQFHDAIRQEVKFAGSSGRTVGTVRETILQRADEFDAPVREDDLRVTREGPFFVVEIGYSVPVDLRLYQHEIRFDWRLSGESFDE